jgi:uncharacterized glyoxalase superfamily protein PhnB
MSENKETRSTVICSMRYRNAPAAIEWLCSVLGFARHAVYPGANGTIEHAELTLGGGMIMLGSTKQDEFGRLMKQPDEIGGAETRSLCLVVSDADEVYQRAKAAGAEMVMDIRDPSYGGREFTCRDPEGRMWSVGTYDPWQAK